MHELQLEGRSPTASRTDSEEAPTANASNQEGLSERTLQAFQLSCATGSSAELHDTPKAASWAPGIGKESAGQASRSDPN